MSIWFYKCYAVILTRTSARLFFVAEGGRERAPRADDGDECEAAAGIVSLIGLSVSMGWYGSRYGGSSNWCDAADTVVCIGLDAD